jgi:hypothetical protein
MAAEIVDVNVKVKAARLEDGPPARYMVAMRKPLDVI